MCDCLGEWAEFLWQHSCAARAGGYNACARNLQCYYTSMMMASFPLLGSAPIITEA